MWWTTIGRTLITVEHNNVTVVDDNRKLIETTVNDIQLPCLERSCREGQAYCVITTAIDGTHTLEFWSRNSPNENHHHCFALLPLGRT